MARRPFCQPSGDDSGAIRKATYAARLWYNISRDQRSRPWTQYLFWASDLVEQFQVGFQPSSRRKKILQLIDFLLPLLQSPDAELEKVHESSNERRQSTSNSRPPLLVLRHRQGRGEECRHDELVRCQSSKLVRLDLSYLSQTTRQRASITR